MSRRPLSAAIVVLLAILCGAFMLPAQSAAQRVVMMGGEDEPRITKEQRSQAVDSINAALLEIYVFPDVAQEMTKLLRKNLKDGKYDDLDRVGAFSERLTEDLRSISHDLHLSVQPRQLDPEPQDPADTLTDEQRLQRRLNQARRDNFSFRKVERLTGNIGYLKLNGFADAAYGGPTAIAAMNFLGYCDALIIDLRENGGGSPSMIQLISSYLFQEPVHLNSFYVRQEDSIHQFWSQAYVPGPRLTDVPVWVLTSKYTFSAAEEFSYNLRNLERATLVGDTTGGGAHPVNRVAWDGLPLGMSLPFGRAINPITGTNWEGVGVAPHIVVPSEEAYDVALMDALETLAEKKTDPQEVYALHWALDGLKAERNKLELDVDDLGQYTGTFGPRRFWIEDGILLYQREGRDPYPMFPMGDDLFGLKGLAYFRVQFERDDNGRVVSLTGKYDNGHTDHNEKTE
ncbi:MAG: S41 family peptidase [candidate division Zixibacteria bacterium]|nr:S41 family peptidase [candidate division Zixibacteria bacterium]